MHIQRHTHTSTHVQSAHKRNGDNQAQEPGWERRKKGFVRDLAHTPKKKCQEKLIFTNLKKGFEHIELPAKLLDYLLWSNKSNINQLLCGPSCNVFTISCICVTRVVVITIMPPSFVSVIWNADSGETLLGPASKICSACNACYHVAFAPPLIDPRVSTCCGALWPLLVTLLRTCSYSADPLLFLPDANLIPLSISKLVHCPSLPACN